MTPPKRNIPGYIFGSAKAGQTTALLAGRSRIKKLPSAEELLRKNEPKIVPEMSEAMDNANLRAALFSIRQVCAQHGRSPQKVDRIAEIAEKALAE